MHRHEIHNPIAARNFGVAFKPHMETVAAQGSNDIIGHKLTITSERSATPIELDMPVLWRVITRHCLNTSAHCMRYIDRQSHISDLPPTLSWRT